jgi:hypothetical protein
VFTKTQQSPARDRLRPILNAAGDRLTEDSLHTVANGLLAQPVACQALSKHESAADVAPEN